MGPDDTDVSSLKCLVAWSVGWFLGFTLVLCWSIWQLPDAGGCGIKAAWVPDAFCREACLMPFCPVVFALPSIFWPVTLVVLVTRALERRFGGRRAAATAAAAAAAAARKLAPHAPHHLASTMREAKHLLPADEESCLAFAEQGSSSIEMDDLSDASSRSSSEDDDLPPLPYHLRATRAIRKKFSRRFRHMPYQPIPPATF